MALSHSARHLRQGIGVPALHGPALSRSIHVPTHPPTPSTAQRIFAGTRTLFSRLVSHLVAPGISHSSSAVSVQPALIRPAHPQNITSPFSLPVKHALSRPFSPPRLPKPPAVPANVAHVGLGTARSFHSGRPIFQNMVDNVPIATRALWEAEWDVKMKKKEARRMHRAMQSKSVPKSREMLKPRTNPVIAEPQRGASELDVYFPLQPTPPVTTHLLVPLAPTPTTRLPLSACTDVSGAHPLLPIADLASIHNNHRLHSLRVSTLFARLDTANVWDDPGVNVDAYAFGPCRNAQEKQCTVLRVSFRGWDASRVRSILGNSAEEWYSLQETELDGRPTLVQLPDSRQDVHVYTRSESPSLESVEVDSSGASVLEMDDGHDVPSPPPIRASASAQHDLILPTLDFSSAFSDAVGSLPPPPQPAMFLRTIPELSCDVEVASQSSFALTDSEGSWECLGLNS